MDGANEIIPLIARFGMPILLAILITAIARLLMHRDMDARSLINLEDLLLGDDGKVSKAAAVMLGSFLLSSWLIIYLALTAKLTEGYFTIYVGAWVIPTVTKLIVNGKTE
jgi:hypothetical protein